MPESAPRPAPDPADDRGSGTWEVMVIGSIVFALALIFAALLVWVFPTWALPVILAAFVVVSLPVLLTERRSRARSGAAATPGGDLPQ
ncbi:MAG: hypothetical protein WCF36_02675 [Candidatus Nanopelagicales bacterium]